MNYEPAHQTNLASMFDMPGEFDKTILASPVSRTGLLAIPYLWPGHKILSPHYHLPAEIIRLNIKRPGGVSRKFKRTYSAMSQVIEVKQFRKYPTVQVLIVDKCLELKYWHMLFTGR